MQYFRCKIEFEKAFTSMAFYWVQIKVFLSGNFDFLNFSPSTRPKFPKFPSNFSSKTKTSKFPIKNHSRTVPKHSITTIMHFKLNFSLYLSNSSGFASCRMQKTTQNVHKHFERQKKNIFCWKSEILFCYYVLVSKLFLKWISVVLLFHYFINSIFAFKSLFYVKIYSFERIFFSGEFLT